MRVIDAMTFTSQADNWATDQQRLSNGLMGDGGYLLVLHPDSQSVPTAGQVGFSKDSSKSLER